MSSTPPQEAAASVTTPLADKAQVLAALDKWVRQRPRIDTKNYGTIKSYWKEKREVSRDKDEAERLLAYVAANPNITAAQLVQGCKTSYDGRLKLTEQGGVIHVHYGVGQYWPTEFRRAVCAGVAFTIWQHVRDLHPHLNGDELRKLLRTKFSPGLVRRWFN